ncbi:MAG: AAA family ATPase, partial [Planctomycetota bacterium]
MTTSPTSNIQFDCKQCGKRLQVPKEFAGKPVQCPECASTQIVPIPSATGQPGNGASAPEESHPLGPPRQAPVESSAPEPSAPEPPPIERKPAQETETKKLFDRIITEVGKIYVGQDEMVLGTLVALFSSGHVLIESVPGLGKTLFIRTLGKVLGCE